MAEKLYLYLARRDKKSVKIVTILKGKAQPTKITSVKNMGLPLEMAEEIDQIIDENKMLNEAWIQSADSYKDLQENLAKRGFKNIPSNVSPIHFNTRHKKKEVKIPVTKPNSMLRKNS